MALGNLLQGYLAAKQGNEAAAMGQVQQAGALQKILAEQQVIQRQQAFQAEMSSANTPEQKLAVAQKYMPASDLGKSLQSSQDRQAQIAATREAGMARLQQAATNYENNFQLRKNAARTQEERLALDQQRESFRQSLSIEAARLAGAQANYNFGFEPNTPPAPTTPPATTGPALAPSPTPIDTSGGPASFNFRLPNGQMLSGNAPSEAAAVRVGQDALGPRLGLSESQAAPQVVPVPAAPNNLDSRDLRLQAAQPQPVSSSAAPATAASPTAAPIPPMPPEIARLPRKAQDAWIAHQGKLNLNVAGGRESVYINRVILSGNEAAADLANVVKLPMTASRGLFGGRGQDTGIFNAGKETLANAMTTQEVQAYNVISTGFQRSLAAIEAAGLAAQGQLVHQMDAVIFKEGDTNFTKLLKLAQTRQIVEKGLETTASNPRVPPETKQHMVEIMDKVKAAVPFTVKDLLELQSEQRANPNITLGDVIGIKKAPAASNGGWSIRPK